MEPTFRLEHFSVENLWGYRDLSLDFFPDVNILIGPNGSGKTTILNLIRFVLTADIPALAQTDFSRITLSLGSFVGRRVRTLSVSVKDDEFIFKVSRRTVRISTREFLERRFMSPRLRREFDLQLEELEGLLSGLVPATWLPVTRRLPIPDEDQDRPFRTGRSRRRRLESVDHRLYELVQELSEYRLGLEARVSKRYKQFERDVLSALLHSEYSAPLVFDPPSEEEQNQLLQAFEGADLLGGEMKRRIERYYEAARQAAVEFRENPNRITREQLRVLPLIPRTKEMARLATALEEDRVEVFAPLRKFEETVNGFLNGKSVQVADSGKLVISSTKDERHFDPDELSSGEKQLLILLVEAVLREGNSVVYVADEPELSLHIEWQEKLIRSLVDLADEVQVIVATHSPDIVGPYRNNIIRLEA